jgi:glycosyltransferase involved in cell wall biosynthesis
MAAKAVPGTTSVIIPCWNQLHYTRQCIAALLRHTRGAWELIVVNNGSSDGTPEYLSNLCDAAPLPVTVIANTKNLGFPAAVNQGLRSARGEFLVLLNNDVVVTDGWLEQLVALTAIAGKDQREGPNAELKATPAEQEPRATHPYPGRNITVIDLPPVPRDRQEPTGERTRNIGLVGPMSNYATPPQLIEGVPYQNLNEMEIFARKWRLQHQGQWFGVPKLSGFCLLMKRAVYEAIGGLDERFGLGLFDDDDLAERARRAGFELAVAKDLFVHHFGSRSFAGNGVDAERLLDENAAKFAAKWGRQAPQGRKITLRPFAPRPAIRPASAAGSPASTRPEAGQAIPTPAAGADPLGAGLPTAPGQRPTGLPPGPDAGDLFQTGSDRADSGPPPGADRISVSLTMIVKNEEANLPQCLGSVRGLFDEIVVVDTGSKDRTVEVARSFGARVFHFTWIDDFAAARNAALQHATGEYAFWLDADDLVEPPERAKLENLLRSLSREQPRAFVVRCACDPGPGGSGGDTVVDHIRLFPISQGVRWTYKVHEQILPSLRRAGVSPEWTDITVRHTGYADRALRAKKLDRDVRILMGELGERPSDPFILFNLGMIAVERRQWKDALTYLTRSLAGSAPSDSITRKLYALIARVHEMLGDTEAALRVCEQGLAVDPDDAELWFRKGVAHRRRGERDQAEQNWRRILTLRRPEKFASVDQGIYGHVTRRNLAALATERGDREEAKAQWRAILEECPGDREALKYLG